MGLFSKMKDILFEEEEVTEEIPKVNPKKETREVPKKEVEEKPISRQIQPEKKPTEEVAPRPIPPKEEPPKRNCDTMSERELFRSENTFPFPAFDEEEFNQNVISSRSRKEESPKPTTNVLEYEKKKRIEKRTEYGRTERTEVREVVERKRFKPSPIISPVYGILNEDYKIEDIKDKRDPYMDSLDIDSVRKKAFEPLVTPKEEPKETYYEEETVTVKVKEPIEEKEQKVRTIDELLEDTSDVTIDVDDSDKQPSKVTKKEYDEIDEELEELINHPKEKKQEKMPDFEDDDTLENDLFDLIDSMYDSREDGEF